MARDWEEPTRRLFREVVRYAEQIIQGPWPEAEARIIDHLRSWDECGLWSEDDFLMRYARLAHPSGWPRLEEILLDEARTSLVMMLCAVVYGHEFHDDHWQALKDLVLEGKCGPAATLRYAMLTKYGRLPPSVEVSVFQFPATSEFIDTLTQYTRWCVGGRWSLAEAYILKKLTSKDRCDAILAYAAEVIQGRWEETEDVLAMSVPHMTRYAHEIVKGRLPDALHQAVLMQSFADPQNRAIKAYVTEFGV